jgi:tRNA G10  N-methylase Trm11
MVFDPFAGTGTTLIVAKQLKRESIGVELADQNVELIKKRIIRTRKADNILIFRDDYKFTDNLDVIWNVSGRLIKQKTLLSSLKKSEIPSQSVI